jgi:hypothetical protein
MARAAVNAAFTTQQQNPEAPASLRNAPSNQNMPKETSNQAPDMKEAGCGTTGKVHRAAMKAEDTKENVNDRPIARQSNQVTAGNELSRATRQAAVAYAPGYDAQKLEELAE